MIQNLWDVVLYRPLINALAFLVSVVPFGDMGISIIILTLLVKIFLFPFSQKTIESQAKIKKLEPELAKIKDSGKTKEEQAKLTMELYKARKINPFSGCLPSIIQIPIILALYFVFYKGINFDSSVLYSFVSAPLKTNMLFLGFLDLGSKNIILAVLAGISQYLLALSQPKPAQKANPASTQPLSFQDSLAKSMNTQMKYVFPFLITFIAYRISGAVALYWITSNIFTVGQQIYATKKTIIKTK